MKQTSKNNSTLRIIAGRWRGKKILFNDGGGIVRPTPDRVRETLFNWLAPYIVDAHCLDLFAGSGILGFEALSRNAASVIAVEQHSIISQHILATKKSLNADIQLIQADVEQWLTKSGQPFDVIFLDPPYQTQVLPRCFQLLAENNWVENGSLVYYENNVPLNAELLPKDWQVLKAQKAGQVYYYLAQVERI